MLLEQIFETSRWLTLYRGEYSGNKGGKFWSEDKEFARQFTQSGRDSEVVRRFVHSSDVYEHKPYAYAGDMDEIEAAVAVAKQKGFSAVRLSEAKGHDDDDTSIYVFDRSALKFSMREHVISRPTQIAALIKGVNAGKLLVHIRVDDGTDFTHGIYPSAGEFLRSTESWQTAEEMHGEGPELIFFADNFSWAKGSILATVRSADTSKLQAIFVRKNDTIVKNLGDDRVKTASGAVLPYNQCSIADYEDPNYREIPAGVERGDWFTNKEQDVIAVVSVAELLKELLKLHEALLLEKGVPPSNSVIFQRMAGNLMHVLAYKISHPSYDHHKTFGIRTASSLGGINLSDMKRFYKPRELPPLIRKFLKEKANLRIAFSNHDRELRPPARGHYDSNRNEILLRMSDEQFNQIRDDLKNGHATIPHFTDEQTAVLVHELTHAYDDWISKGKYKENARSKEAHNSRFMALIQPNNSEAQAKKEADYFNDPIEINARFYQTVAKLSRSQNPETTPWRPALREFLYEFPMWKEIPEDEKRRLVKRFARVWLEGQRPRERNYVEDVDKLGKKLRDEFGEIYIRYNASPNRQSILMDSGFKQKLPIGAIQACIRFCDIRKITLGLETPFTPDLKSLGFVKNTGRTKRYDLSWLCTCYREPRSRSSK